MERYSLNDWTGSKRSAYATLGASNHTTEPRADFDYYATEPAAARLLLEVEEFSPCIWECACGEGHISEEFQHAGYTVFSSDIVDRGYGCVIDFLSTSFPQNIKCDIVTNPPYSKAAEFIKHAMDIVADGTKVAMFLKLQFLEGKARKALFKQYPPKIVYVSSSRLVCAKNGDFESNPPRAVAYAWYVWVKGFHGDPVIKWIN